MSLHRALYKNFLLKKLRKIRKKKRRVTSLDKTSKAIELNSEALHKFYFLVNLTGYLLLTLTFLDYLALLIPPNFFNPTWELNTIGQLVESVWAPILGFLCIFFRMPKQKIKFVELKLLSLVSWLLLFTSIVYFLSVPLIISDTVRINRQNFSQFTSQVTQQKTKVAAMEKELQTMPDERLTSVFSQSPIVLPSDSSDTIRKKLIEQLQKERQNSFNQTQFTYQQQKNTLIENSLRWAIEALLSGIVTIVIWRNTKWSDRRYWVIKKGDETQPKDLSEQLPSISAIGDRY